MPYKNKEQRKEYFKQYYELNKDKIKSDVKAKRETPEGQAYRKEYLKQYNIDKKEFIAKSQARCYKRKSEAYKERIRRRFREHAELVAKIKVHYGCMNQECKWQGSWDAAILDLHHRDPSQKEMRVSSMLCRSKRVIAEEINKCIVLCANCHRLVHIMNIELPDKLCQVTSELAVQ
jgi:hypothetical protein